MARRIDVDAEAPGIARTFGDDPYARIARLESALDNMPQGLCMFDAERRLIVSNPRYAEMFGLPPELTKPGTSLLEILKYRVASGRIPRDDAEAYIRDRLAIADRVAPSKSRIELEDGRIYSLVHEPMERGGWISTHEDITEQVLVDRELERTRAFLIEARTEAERASEQARSAHQLLLEAFDVVPESLTLFDARDRYVLWNKQCEELHNLLGVKLAGARFEDVLRAGLRNGHYPAAIGREEAWYAERMMLHAAARSVHEQELPGGRWVRIEERRTSDGGSIGIGVDITDLKRRQESFRLLFDSNPVPMWVYDRETLGFLAVNDAAVAHYGHAREAFLAMTVLDIRPKEEWDLLRQAASCDEPPYEEGRIWRHLKADGGEILVNTYARSIVYEGRKGRLVSAIDVTDRVRVGAELRRAQEFLNLIVESVPGAIFVRDAGSRQFTLLNRGAEEFLGMRREDVVGKTAEEIYSADSFSALAKQDEELFRVGHLRIESHKVNVRGKSARQIALNHKLLKNGDGDPRYLLTVIEDITERKRAEERISHLAHHDPLTNLPNRAAFNERLERTLNRAADTGERFAVLCIDLDRLKEVNDVFGHAAGDEMLREVSRRLSSACADAFLARLGGDEFAIVAETADPSSSVSLLAKRLLAAVEAEVDIDGARIRAGLSIGVAIFPEDGREGTILMANADAALYRAKAEGRGRARFFERDMDRRLRERHVLRHELTLAIERDELTMFYQPQARMSGEVIGFEALLRWAHPTRGWVPPDVFIPIAEESHLIVRIGERVLREVCREAASWPRRLNVAVNLSPVQFQHGDLPSLIHAILLETGLAANRLELEITEGVLIENSARALSILRRLKAFGVRIAMDDFGKGYSSLSYLQSFPFDKIKIDRSFVAKVEQNPQSAAIVRAVLGLARGLKLPVLAEGVETAEELAFLAGEACDLAQGYLIGRPFPIADYADIVGRPRPSPKMRLLAAR